MTLCLERTAGFTEEAAAAAAWAPVDEDGIRTTRDCVRKAAEAGHGRCIKAWGDSHLQKDISCDSSRLALGRGPTSL